MTSMFESKDWSPTLRRAAENFVKTVILKDSATGAILKTDLKLLEKLLNMAFKNGYELGFYEGLKAQDDDDCPDKEEDFS